MDKDKLVKEINDFANNRMWITKKSRMNAESRYLSYDFHSLVILNLCSAILLITTILTAMRDNAFLTITNIILSILLLVASLIIACLKFKNQADDYKTSYIKIDALYMRCKALINKLELEEVSISEANNEFFAIMQQYNDILSTTNNHKTIDYLSTKQFAIQNDNSKTSNKRLSIKKYSFLILIVMCWLILLGLLGVSVWSYFNVKA